MLAMFNPLWGKAFNVNKLINKSLYTCSTNCHCLYCCLVTRMLHTYLNRIVQVTSHVLLMIIHLPGVPTNQAELFT